MSSPPEEDAGGAVGPSWQECMDLFDRLPGMPLERRAEVIERLLRNSSPGIRERALRIAAAVLTEETLAGYLRREADAVLRNAGLEILKQRGPRSYSLAVELLKDEDPSVALQAVLILDHLKDPRAVEPLRSAVNDADPNVVQAAIVAIGHLGDARSVPDLLPFLEADPWLRLAAVQALGDLRSSSAVAPLAELLTDLTLGGLAAEALAQIGGFGAFEALSAHWLRFQEELDTETSLGLLAHVLEGLARAPQDVEGLRTRLAERLRDPYREVRVAAARCLLALGEGPEDGEALHIVAENLEDENVLPSCLTRRRDLIDDLLEKAGPQRNWGFLLLARHPRSGSTGKIAAALADERAGESLESILEALPRVRSRALAEPLLDLFLSLPPDGRARLLPLLEHHRATLSGLVAERTDLRAEERLELAAVVGRPAEEIRSGIVELEPEGREEVVSLLTDRREIVAGLPWGEWLRRDPESYRDLASRVAIDGNLRQLLPELRRLLAEAPSVDVVRAVAELGDRESIPLLLELIATRRSILRPVVVESLGRIGGPEARHALRELAAEDDARLARVAYRALANCATEEDDAFFREAVSHPDWYVRLACAEVLGRFERAQNLAVLSELAADPVEIVSRRALAALEG